ncbi:MAG: tRNA (N(6)-L-threonylcarbamoyladenosine(37)-C(2))-methylthiotransferase MtaB [Spirochaetota bacterium]
MKIAFYTLGCKLNQYESEALASSFRSQGFLIVPPGRAADIYIINTCTVTSKSDQKARRLIRKLSKEHPDASLIITGCYAELNPESILELGGNISIVPQSQKDLLLDFPVIFKKLLSGNDLPGQSRKVIGNLLKSHNEAAANRFRFEVSRFTFHSRAALKIQDGCDNLCSYCRVPLARGRSVSLFKREILNRVGRLEQEGYREIVLTGVNISSYFDAGTSLSDLLKLIVTETERVRFRLSSLEPDGITAGLLDVLSEKRICPHFHIPVQSGSDAILTRMHREYTAAQLREIVTRLKTVKAEPFLAADIIVGFPGESDKDFTATLRLVEELEFTKLHVFPYSPRPGTQAARLKDDIPSRVKKERSRVLREISDTMLLEYCKQNRGKTREAVLEGRTGHDGTTAWVGRTENYLPLIITGLPAESPHSGLLLRCEVFLSGDTYYGHFVDFI